ncbi:MAG: cysteine synthase family protein [Dehalococcoidia bacterium]
MSSSNPGKTARAAKSFDILSAIGNTPLVRIENVYAKFEGANPTGSIKDRAALEMIEAAEREGKLKKGYTIVEPTSGNTGISLAMIAAIKGYKMVAVMPENMSEERRQIIRALGAQIVLTSESGSLAESIEKAEEIASKPKTFMPQQFSNPNNIVAQEKTGREILEEIGAVDAVVAGVGTGGTLMGISNVMREVNPNVKVIAVEPEEAAVMFGGSDVRISEHKIQGIGDGFIPHIINMELVDEAITVGSQEAVDMARKLSREYGLLVGISSGANILIALKVTRKFGKVATVLPDRGDRYLSMDLFKY